MAYSKSRKGVSRFPSYGAKARSQKPGTTGRQPRAARTTQRTIPQRPRATSMPPAPVGKAITKKNQDRLPRR